MNSHIMPYMQSTIFAIEAYITILQRASLIYYHFIPYTCIYNMVLIQFFIGIL
jgi:hypothetical protein